MPKNNKKTTLVRGRGAKKLRRSNASFSGLRGASSRKNDDNQPYRSLNDDETKEKHGIICSPRAETRGLEVCVASFRAEKHE